MKPNAKEQQWFVHLHNSQLEDLKVFMKPKYFNVFNGVIDKYSDSAHFIYELLQNADDAGATEVEMELQHGRFIFSHNGRIRFTVSNPETEVQDRKVGKLGHINSICSIGFSSKNYESEIKENKIGKFGVGFKAVFQYTSTPEIYDYPFCFRIDNYIVPTSIERSLYQKQNKTVFVLPFNHEGITPERAFEEISQKLKNLDYPQLFLHNIRSITWRTPSESDVIEKALDIEGKSDDITYSLYTLKKKGDRQRILILRRLVEVPNHGNHEVAIGYYIDHGRIVTKSTRNIHCFFPTNENIGTCYVIHAPFALVDNRQQIKRDNDINRSLFNSIAELAADSLLILRDWDGFDKAKLLNDNIIQLIKYDTTSYDGDNYWYNSRRIDNYFKESYDNIFEDEPLFLSRSGVYLTKNQGWWATDDILKLFDDNQIIDLTVLSIQESKENEEDEEVDEEYTDKSVYGFVLCSVAQRDLDESSINIDKLDGEVLSKQITSAFMVKQSLDWLERFYDYVLRRRLVEDYELNKGNRSNAPMRYAQIIKNQEGDFVCAYGRDKKLNVFFYEEGVTYADKSINTELYDASGKFKEVIKELKIKVPGPLDSIRIQLNRQMEKLDNKESIQISDINDIFIKAIRFYNSCSINERKELIQLMSETSVFLCDFNDEEDNVFVDKSQNIYKDLPVLREYFRAFKNDKISRPFFHTCSYHDCIEVVGMSDFNEFISKFAIKDSPSVISQSMSLTSEEYSLRASHKIYRKEFPSLEGLINILETFEKGEGSESLSHYIWDLLIKTYRADSSFFRNNVSNYSYYGDKTQKWSYNSLIGELQSRRWLYVNGELKCIKEDAYKEELLDSGYTYDADLLEKLEISSPPNVQEAEIINEMSEGTREAYALGKELKNLGITSIEEIKRMRDRLTQLERKEEAEAAAQFEREERAKRRKQEEETQNPLPKRKKSAGLQGSDFERPDNVRAKSHQTENTQSKSKNIEDILEGFEEKARVQRDELEKVANLRDRIEQAPKYSYDWFLSLMELEVQSQGSTGASGKKALYISFDTISFNPKNDRMMILSDASRYVPASLEDLDALPVTFVFRNGSVEKFSFESASVKEDNLILKCGEQSKKIIEALKKNFDKLQHAFIEVNEPIDILTQWQSRLKGLDLKADFSLKENLRPNIEFIFGPPGTGKTTTLARRINEIVDSADDEIRILVLAPTNKACDVLTRKLHELNEGDDGWIWRFVKTDDPFIEDEELVYGRDSQVSRPKKVCVISTITRYAFDGFEDGDLRTIEWDYVFIDEASMIPLYEIVLPIYNPLSGKIIISGDPFQIEPIVNIDLWKKENIYKMVNLKDFINPKTEPYQFNVTPLLTQYRSIPVIGELFSNYLYGGKLLHNRRTEDHKLLKMGLVENPLHVISFPVGKDSIFDLKRLNKSNIQVYSVVFTVEFLKYISRKLDKSHPGNEIRIGVVSPYSAEIQAIQKIYNQSAPQYDYISVDFGSAHGFQGDQCDIIVAVINPPASGLKRAADMTFVNNQNILNVAISRASDYLFLLIPEKDYENFDSLYEIKKIGRKMTSLKCSFTTSDEIEKVMFGESQFIESNTYVTSHKTTNVFNTPFTKYEIRIDENAIDIQINDL